MPGGAGFLPSTEVSFWDGQFSGAMSVSFRECNLKCAPKSLEFWMSNRTQ